MSPPEWWLKKHARTLAMSECYGARERKDWISPPRGVDPKPSGRKPRLRGWRKRAMETVAVIALALVVAGCCPKYPFFLPCRTAECPNGG